MDPFWQTLSGNRVFHSRYGSGTIIKVEQYPDRWPYFYVSFEDGVTRHFNDQLFDHLVSGYLVVPRSHPIPAHLQFVFLTQEQRDRGENYISLRREQEEREERERKEKIRAVEQARLDEQRRKLLELLDRLKPHYGICLPRDNSLSEQDINELDNLRTRRMTPELEQFLVNQGLYQVLAIHFTLQYRNYGELGILSTACKYWRKANKATTVLELSDEIAGYYRDGQWCMVWTSRGAALTDLGKYEEAVRCGTTVLDVQQKQPHPYNMLGRTYILLGDNEKGLEHFRIANSLGSNRRVVTNMLKGVMKELEPQRRRELRTTMHEMAAADDSLGWLMDVPF
jgi:tetratricopeptide (TPR) repeat protein